MDYITIAVKGLIDKVQKSVDPREAHKMKKLPYLKQARLAIASAYRATFDPQTREALMSLAPGAKNYEEMLAFAEISTLNATYLAALVVPNNLFRPYSIEPDIHLVRALECAHRPKGIDDDYFLNNKIANVWHVRLPDGVRDPRGDLMIALFWLPEKTLFTAITLRNGDFQYVTYCPGPEKSWSHPYSTYPFIPTEDAEVIVNYAKDLMILLILHLESKIMAETAPEDLKVYHQNPRGQISMNARKPHPDMRLFRTIRLEKSVADYSNRKPRHGVPGKLAHSFSVRGHFRYHAYGKRELNLRKLIWIDEFIKGTGELDDRPVNAVIRGDKP